MWQVIEMMYTSPTWLTVTAWTLSKGAAHWHFCINSNTKKFECRYFIYDEFINPCLVGNDAEMNLLETNWISKWNNTWCRHIASTFFLWSDQKCNFTQYIYLWWIENNQSCLVGSRQQSASKFAEEKEKTSSRLKEKHFFCK